MKQTATFWCEQDALRFLQRRKYTGEQHGKPAAETRTTFEHSLNVAPVTPAGMAARAAAAALAAVAALPIRITPK